MAGRTIEFPNDQGPAYERASSGSQGTNRHGMGLDNDEELARGSRFGLNRSPQLTRAAELSALMVHKLKEPLTSILANAQAAKRWLAAKPPNLTEAIASIDRIARDTRVADETMEQIRATFGHAPLNKKKGSVPAVMIEAVRVVLEDPSVREIAIKWDIDESLPTISMDELAIREVFLILLSNAVGAFENDPTFPQVTLQAAVNDESEMVVKVADNGPPIGDLEDVFNPFVNTPRTELGIGLAVSRSIAEAHGGRLWAENNPDGGATFCLALPLSLRNPIFASA